MIELDTLSKEGLERVNGGPIAVEDVVLTVSGVGVERQRKETLYKACDE